MGKKSGNRKDLSDLVTVVTVETVKPLPDNSRLTPGSDLPFPQNVFQAIVVVFFERHVQWLLVTIYNSPEESEHTDPGCCAGEVTWPMDVNLLFKKQTTPA